MLNFDYDELKCSIERTTSRYFKDIDEELERELRYIVVVKFHSGVKPVRYVMTKREINIHRSESMKLVYGEVSITKI